MRKFAIFLAAVLLLTLAAGLVMNNTAKATGSIIQVDPSIIRERPPFDFLTLSPRATFPPRVTTPPDKPTRKPDTGGGQLMNNEGPLFLSFLPELTDKLLMFTPMNLSQDGEYRFPLIGNTTQVVGETKVVVKSGMVIVTYLVVNGVNVNQKEEFFTFFPDIRSVPSVEPRKLQDVKLKFGIPYSIQNWIGGDAQVLIYINCPVSYKNNLPGLTSFSFQDADYLDRMMALLPLMD